jgi:hypothetical protein
MLMAHVGNTTVDPNAGPAREDSRSEAVTIPESSARLGHYELFVVVSDIGREQIAPPPLQRISLDDVSPHVR